MELLRKILLFETRSLHDIYKYIFIYFPALVTQPWYSTHQAPKNGPLIGSRTHGLLVSLIARSIKQFLTTRAAHLIKKLRAHSLAGRRAQRPSPITKLFLPATNRDAGRQRMLKRRHGQLQLNSWRCHDQSSSCAVVTRSLLCRVCQCSRQQKPKPVQFCLLVHCGPVTGPAGRLPPETESYNHGQ